MDVSVAIPSEVKTHCKEGHPLSGGNLKLTTKRRVCITCERLRNSAYAKRQRQSGKLRAGYTAAVINSISPALLERAFDAISKTGSPVAAKKIVGRSRWTALLYFSPEIKSRARALAEDWEDSGTGLFVLGRTPWNKGRHRRYCKNGHEIAGENLVILKLHGGPTRACRECYKARRTRDEQSGRIDEERIRRVIAAIEDGQTISSITDTRCGARFGTKRIVARPKLVAFARNNPKLGRLIFRRAEENSERLRQDRRSLSRVKAPTIVNARILILWDIIRASVPAGWPEEMRKEAIGRVGLELSDGRCKPTEAAIHAAVLRAGADHNRMFSEYAMGGGAGKWVSLDAPKYEDGATTVGDTVSQGLWG